MVLGAAHIHGHTLVDRCYIDTRTGGDGFGSDRGDIVYTEGDTLTRCRIAQHEAREVEGKGKGQISTATIRLPRDTALTETDRLRVVKRFGRVLTSPRLYAIIAVAETGGGLTCEAAEAKGGTAQ